MRHLVDLVNRKQGLASGFDQGFKNLLGIFIDASLGIDKNEDGIGVLGTTPRCVYHRTLEAALGVLENSRRILFNDMGLQDFGQPITAMDDEWMVPSIPSSADVLKVLKNQNPNLLISQARINLGDLSYKLVRGLRLPSLNSSMNYSANGETSDELMDALKDEWSLGMNLSVSFPIYTGNSLSMQQQQAKLSKQQSEYSYITLLNDLRVQAELIRESLNNYAEIIPLNQAVVTSAEEDLKLVRERYSLGSATILEVLDAQVSLIRSNSTLINTIHDARMQEASLKALLGTLDMEYKLEEN